MQHKDKKTILLAETIGKIIKGLRQEKEYSINKLANEYSLDIGNTSRIEKGSIDVKVVTLWKLSEALAIKPSQIIKMVEDELGEKFLFMEE